MKRINKRMNNNKYFVKMNNFISFIIFIDEKINEMKFSVLNWSVCKLVMIYNNVKNK